MDRRGIVATGTIVWAPWISLLSAVILAPSVREGEVLSRAQREYLHRVPVTPKESAAWVGLCAPPPRLCCIVQADECAHYITLQTAWQAVCVGC
jgi:hypothetical protein